MSRFPFTDNRRFPNPTTVTGDTRSHTIALQQIIEALNIGQRRTRDVANSYVRLNELEAMGLIEIIGSEFNIVPINTNPPKPYLYVYDTTSQPVTGVNQATPVTYNTVDLSYETYLGDNTSELHVKQAGIYNYQFSAQLDHTGGGAAAFVFWLRKNGVDVPNTATKVVMSGPNTELVAAWNFFVQMAKEDYVELYWTSLDPDTLLLAEPAAPPVPEIPSVIASLQYVSAIP